MVSSVQIFYILDLQMLHRLTGLKKCIVLQSTVGCCTYTQSSCFIIFAKRCIVSSCIISISNQCASSHFRWWMLQPCFVLKPGLQQGTINCAILGSGIGGSGDPRRKWEEMGEREREREREIEREKCCFCLQNDLKEP